MAALKKWTSILNDLEKRVPNLETPEDYKVLLNQFESIDEDCRDKFAPQSYRLMWRVALRSGKLNLANLYIQKFLKYLVSNKRIPQIKIFINEFLEAGIFKKKAREYLAIGEILLGKKKNVTDLELNRIEFFIDHPEFWKFNTAFLQQYLLLNSDWSLAEWTLCYEYILLNHFDKEVFIILLDKTREFKKEKSEKKLIELFMLKKIKVRKHFSEKLKIDTIQKNELNVDYDQVAMDLLSGAKGPSSEEQRRVINSLKFISDEELKLRGYEMVVAFELLGLEQVVLSLCEKMISLLSDTKEKARIYYVWAQALSNVEDFYKTRALVDEVIQQEPLLQHEKVALLYLKAEACLKLKKIKMAKALFLEIKKQNPHYRLVQERLKTLETY